MVRIVTRAAAIHASAAALALAAFPAYAQQAPDTEEITVTARRLDEARNGLSPRTGASQYVFDRTAIDTQPQGPDRSFNRLLLQAPGVVQEGNGGIHIRGDHADLQYRLNGILIPEGVGGFGDTFETRFANKVELLTGALPAQYGYRTAGVIEIETKDGARDNGGSVSLYGGSNGTIKPSAEIGGSSGGWSYFASGSYFTSDRGLDAPTPGRDVLHDSTSQARGFVYLSKVLNSDTRVSLIAGSSTSRFEIPNTPGQQPAFTLNGRTTFDSAQLNERQRESNSYAIVALQGSSGRLDWQIAPFLRYSQVRFAPDPVGDLMFSGVAADVKRSSFAGGLQADASYRINDQHTLRGGLFTQGERGISKASVAVFDVADDGTQLSDQPRTIANKSARTGYLYGAYLQDEWKVTDRLTINAGLRYDLVNAYVNESSVEPRISAVYKLTDKTTVHAGYSRFFIPPALELVGNSSLAAFAGTTNAPAVTQNDPVRSERADYYDVGVSHQLLPGLQLGLDGYIKKSRNLQDEGQFGQALILTPINFREGHVYGVEFSAAYRRGGFSAYANATWMRASGIDIISSQFGIDPEELAYIQNNWVKLDHDQRYTASAGTSYAFDTGTTVALDGLYQTGLSKGFASTQHVTPYLTMNLGVSQDFTALGANGWSARFDVLNLTDRVYQIRDGSGIGVGQAQYGVRRAIFAGVTKKF
ncbi:MAG: tonB-dependent Receptor Plug domain protein [Rhodospirillales bacterium]|nr:tonB-dependent Receptor Plug domain protein [Rhodospirillales bacterium]